jgi:hypothetical protein
MALKLIYPLLAQVLWTFVVLGVVFVRRQRAFASKAVRPADVAVSTERYPEPARLAAANFANQFETPVLFYALIAAAIAVGATGTHVAALAWGYVATRIVHTLIHTGANHVPLRAVVFALGVACLMLIWLSIVLSLL